MNEPAQGLASGIGHAISEVALEHERTLSAKAIAFREALALASAAGAHVGRHPLLRGAEETPPNSPLPVVPWTNRRWLVNTVGELLGDYGRRTHCILTYGFDLPTNSERVTIDGDDGVAVVSLDRVLAETMSSSELRAYIGCLVGKARKRMSHEKRELAERRRGKPSAVRFEHEPPFIESFTADDAGNLHNEMRVVALEHKQRFGTRPTCILLGDREYQIWTTRMQSQGPTEVAGLLCFCLPGTSGVAAAGGIDVPKAVPVEPPKESVSKRPSAFPLLSGEERPTT